MKREPATEDSSPSKPQKGPNSWLTHKEEAPEAEPAPEVGHAHDQDQDQDQDQAQAQEQEKQIQRQHEKSKQKQKQKQKQEVERRTRPSRACTVRAPPPLIPEVPPKRAGTTPKRGRATHQHPRDGALAPDPPMALVAEPPSPSHKPRWLLRSMWELAAILHFLNVFRPILKLKAEFTIEDLESALLTPNPLLEEIHVALLKAIPPICRGPIKSETWVALLSKKMNEWWGWVAEGPFPLASHQGNELAAYMELSPDIRVIILKALVEARTDQDDVRTFIDDMLKQGVPFSHVRKERTGADMQGTTYWYENDPIAGQRLYRELWKIDYKEKPKMRGRLMPPPSVGCWETLATNLEEFQAVADKLSTSRNRMEVDIAKRINNEIIPDLEDLQKKRERALKKQQRQSVLLNSIFSNEELTAGRSKRERKPVTYTFDDYDKSISEAIKITKRRASSPGLLAGDSKLSAGSPKDSDDESNINELEDQEMAGTTSQIKANETKGRSKLAEPATSRSSESDEDGKYGRGRRRRKLQRYAEYDLDNAMSESESEYSGEDDIEEEAANYAKKKRKVADSSDGDDEYRGEEEDEAEEEEDDDDGDGDDDDDDEEEDFVGSSDEEDYGRRRRSLKNTVKGRKRGRSRDSEQEGLRRSQRANKSHVNYSKYEESDVDSDVEGDSDSHETSGSDERRVDNSEAIDDDRSETEFECITEGPEEKNNKVVFLNQDLNLLGHPDDKSYIVSESKVIRERHADDKSEVALSMAQGSNLKGYSDDKNGMVSSIAHGSNLTGYSDDKNVMVSFMTQGSNLTGYPDNKNDMASFIAQGSNRTGYSDDKDNMVSGEIGVGTLGHRTTMNGVAHGPFEDVKPRSQVHRFLDLNVAAPPVGGLDDISQATGETRNDYHVF